MVDAAQAKKKDGEGKGKVPWVPISDLKDVFFLFADRKTQLLPLNDVPYVLRACGMTIYGDEEASIKAEVEKVDGLGKPVAFQTLQDWKLSQQDAYNRTFDEIQGSFWSLCNDGFIGDKSSNIVKLPHLRHLVSEVGDKIKPETFDKILKADESIKGDAVSVDDLLAFMKR
mmetsp:Transcript_143678/g.374217  ORF Transcript_143678/g.374217 Transcript_143678/m.374217 type:complete len:171 (+) Transcript_143678:117-629(+)